MKTGQESVKAALREFFDSAAEDLERTMENLRQGQFTHTRTQPKGVTQIINYTTVALLPVLSSLFEHIGQNLFGEDLIREYHPHSFSNPKYTPSMMQLYYQAHTHLHSHSITKHTTHSPFPYILTCYTH